MTKLPENAWQLHVCNPKCLKEVAQPWPELNTVWVQQNWAESNKKSLDGETWYCSLHRVMDKHNFPIKKQQSLPNSETEKSFCNQAKKSLWWMTALAFWFCSNSGLRAPKRCKRNQTEKKYPILLTKAAPVSVHFHSTS